MQDVGMLLSEDFRNNLGMIQLAGFGISGLIALIGTVLAARAATLLGEARETYWQAQRVVIEAARSGEERTAPVSGVSSPLPAPRKLRRRKNTDVLR